MERRNLLNGFAKSLRRSLRFGRDDKKGGKKGGFVSGGSVKEVGSGTNDR
jgi:hypothetical protein